MNKKKETEERNCRRSPTPAWECTETMQSGEWRCGLWKNGEERKVAGQLDGTLGAINAITNDLLHGRFSKKWCVMSKHL